uniref:Uncharacterized protein n=1 Tax=Caenorhabditis japonica TaxID=281687 RepID=A0A8R1HFT3_CAEJA
MNENDCEECLNPKISNAWDRQKTFFGVAAAQSSVGKANPYLPESLLSPLVTVLDPCTLSASIHTQVDWKLVEPRLVRNNIMSKQRIAPRRVIQKDMDTSSDFEFNSDGCGSRSDSPLYLGRTPRANNGERSEPIDLTNFEDAEENLMKKEKDIFIDEIVDLIRNVRKHNDASLASSQTWVDTLLVDKISKQLILIQSYLPQMLSVEEIVNALLFENGPAVLENLLIEMPEHVVAIVNVLTKSLMQGSKGRYRNLVIGRVLTLYPYFVRRVIEKFSKNRSDCVFACRLAVDHLDDKQFLQFLEPMLTEKESLLSKIVLRSSGRQVLPMVIDRLLAMAEVVNEYDMNAPPGTPSPEMGVSPWCTRLAFCLVELLNLTLETWQERDIVIITRFVFRTSATPSSSTESGMLADEPMDFSTMHDSVDSVVPDSDPETSQSVVARPKVSPGESVEDSPFGDAHESFVLSALIAVPFFTQYPINNTGAVQPPDRAVDNWLDIARKRALVGDKVTSTFCVNLIYVHSCIMSSRIDELAEFASDGMKQRIELSSRHNHAHVLKNAFTSRCMTEIEVAKRSVCQRVAKCEGGDRSDQLALKSIHALQATGVYKTFQIDIRSRKHPGQVKTSRFLILSQSTGMRGCVILLEDEAISTEEQEELLFWDVLT